MRTQKNGADIGLLMKGNWSDLLRGQEHPCDISGQNAPAQEAKLSFILYLVLGMITRLNRRGSFLNRIKNVNKLRYMWYFLDKGRKQVEAKMIQRKINKKFRRRKTTNAQKGKGTERKYYWIRRLEKEHLPLPPRPCQYFWPRSASYLVGTRCSCSKSKAAGMWRWPMVFKRYRALGCTRNYLRSVYSLKSRKGFHRKLNIYLVFTEGLGYWLQHFINWWYLNDMFLIKIFLTWN